ncbi:hypothetical protein [Falsibacillus pallidus]|uniref:hypothetical protein n=1 Tax=Falsibacillus pallidus TaxID=493781 RepID=UPI003D95557B
MSKRFRRWRGLAAGTLAAIIIAFQFFPFVVYAAGDVKPFNLNVKGFNLDVDPYHLNKVTPFNLDVDPFSLKGDPSNGNADVWLKQVPGTDTYLGPVGPVRPIEMPDGTVLVPNGDGTFTPARPGKLNSPELNHLDATVHAVKPTAKKDEKPDFSWVDAMNLVANDVGGTTAAFAGDMVDLSNQLAENPQLPGQGNIIGKSFRSYGLGMATTLYKVGVKGTSWEWTGDAYDTYTHGAATAQSANQIARLAAGKAFNNASRTSAQGTASILARYGGTASEIFKPVSRLNMGIAAVGTVTSGITAGSKWYEAVHAKTDAERDAAMGETIGAVGDTMMNAGVLIATIPLPGAQVVGAAVGVIGGALWLGATAYKYRKSISKAIRSTKIGKAVLDSKPAKAVKKAASKAWGWAKKTLFGG